MGAVERCVHGESGCCNRSSHTPTLLLYQGTNMMKVLVIAACLVDVQSQSQPLTPPYEWKCQQSIRDAGTFSPTTPQTGGENVCVRHVRLAHNSSSTMDQRMSQNECRLTCGEFGVLWPKPTNVTTMGKKVAYFRPQSVTFNLHPDPHSRIGDLLGKGVQVFMENLLKSHPNYSPLDEVLRSSQERYFFGPTNTDLYDMNIEIKVTESNETSLTMDTNEAYELQVVTDRPNRKINVVITAPSYFGARHGLETLSQMIAYCFESNSLMIVDTATIKDQPKFPYRGLLVDTARNFIPISSIKANLEAMAASKLNTFHWHITDSHSFPMFMRAYPKMHHYGAYDPSKVYTPQDIKEIVEFGRVRGIRVLPEFDAPAHVGHGWEWGPEEKLGELVACLAREPWQSYCVEPPCGQLNIANNKIYEVLGNIYKEMVESFGTLDMFHYGGDEVNLNCWNTTDEITTYMQTKYSNLTEDSYYKEWSYFQNKAFNLLNAANKKEVPGVLWTSHLTEKGRVDKFLDPLKYIIQIWTKGDDLLIKELLDKKFRLIFSNYDALYLDCGFGAWVGEGNNWCSPYIGWQKVYDNSPLEISFNLTKTKAYDGLIQGGEAAMWTEQVDGANLHSKVWPRVAALAERLWSNPSHGWQLAEHRMIYHRQRLVQRGIPAERLQPEFCLQNEDLCYVNRA